MSVRIAISDPLPAFRRGIMAILGDAGFDSEAPDDLMAWLRDEQRRVILMTLQSTEDWALLEQLRRSRPDIIVIAVLEGTSVASYVRALTAGAVSALPRDAPAEGVRQVFEAAMRGASLLPTDVIRALASPGEPPPHAPDAPSARELEWLQELARGATVVQLANRAGYSERAMFRLLRGLYAKMEVKNRTEALMQARERGWL
jgi:DNA-binding NarL/FixJ family response regulator